MATKEEELAGLFDTATSQIKDSKASPTAQIAALKVLCNVIDQSKLAETSEICALVASEMQPRLKKIRMPKGDRWFRKYTDAKYKRPQDKKHVHYGSIQKAAAATIAAINASKKKSRLRVNVDNPADEGRTEECPECGAKTPNPKNLGELVCSGCQETFYIDAEVPTAERSTENYYQDMVNKAKEPKTIALQSGGAQLFIADVVPKNMRAKVLNMAIRSGIVKKGSKFKDLTFKIWQDVFKEKPKDLGGFMLYLEFNGRKYKVEYGEGGQYGPIKVGVESWNINKWDFSTKEKCQKLADEWLVYMREVFAELVKKARLTLEQTAACKFDVSYKWFDKINSAEPSEDPGKGFDRYVGLGQVVLQDRFIDKFRPKEGDDLSYENFGCGHSVVYRDRVEIQLARRSGLRVSKDRLSKIERASKPLGAKAKCLVCGKSTKLIGGTMGPGLWDEEYWKCKEILEEAGQDWMPLPFVFVEKHCYGAKKAAPIPKGWKHPDEPAAVKSAKVHDKDFDDSKKQAKKLTPSELIDQAQPSHTRKPDQVAAGDNGDGGSAATASPKKWEDVTFLSLTIDSESETQYTHRFPAGQDHPNEATRAATALWIKIQEYAKSKGVKLADTPGAGPVQIQVVTSQKELEKVLKSYVEEEELLATAYRKLDARAEKQNPPKKEKNPALKKQIEDQKAVIKVVERTDEEGYNAYPGDASKKLDQPHIIEKKYTIAEIMATPLFTYKKDPVDKRHNTNVCGHCGSSKLDWTSLVMMDWSDGKEFLQKAKHSNDHEGYRNIGFFQCNTCHAFLIGEDDVPYVKIEKQEDGSYRLKVADPLLKESVPVESTAIIDLKMDGVATKGKILQTLLTGPLLAADHPLAPVQKALRDRADHEAIKDYENVKKELVEQRAMAAQAYRELETAREEAKAAKKELATRATKEETAKLETVTVQVEELKTEVQYLRDELAKRAITTADKLVDFWIFIPKKYIADLVKTIDQVNWQKKPGLAVRSDGKIGTAFKVGEPLE